MAITESVIFDHSVDGNTAQVVLDCTSAKRVTLHFRDITFAASDRPILYTSTDGGTTKDNGASDYEAFSQNMNGSIATSNAGFTFSGVVMGSNSTGPHDGTVNVEGIAASNIRTQFWSMGSDGTLTSMRLNWRAAAAAEDALVIEGGGAGSFTGGQITAIVET